MLNNDKKTLRRICIILVACVTPVLSPVVANAAVSPWAASLGLGTMGITAGLQYRESTHFVADASVGGLAIDPSFSAGGEQYKMGIRLLSAKLVEDWYPFKHNNLFLSAGILINGNKFNLHPTATKGNYSFATPASFQYAPVDPYFGVGYGYPFSGSRWTFLADAGAAYEGSAHVAVDMGTDPYAVQAYQDEKTSIATALNGSHWYPVIQTALVYRFW